MKLQKARICISCDEIHDQPVCPSCTSHVWHPLQDWIRPVSLNRPTAAEVVRGVSCQELERLYEDR